MFLQYLTQQSNPRNVLTATNYCGSIKPGLGGSTTQMLMQFVFSQPTQGALNAAYIK